MCRSYLQVAVAVDKRSPFLSELKCLTGRGRIHWNKVRSKEGVLYYHLTLAFLNRVPDGVNVKQIVEDSVRGVPAPVLSFDKVFAFTTTSGREHIVALTSSAVPDTFTELVNGLRKRLTDAGCEISNNFLFHATLGRVGSSKCSLESLQSRIDEMRPFKLNVTPGSVEHILYLPGHGRLSVVPWGN